MEFNKLNSVWDTLNTYDYMAKETDEISVSEWTNGEGYDIAISKQNHTENFSFTEGELDAINYLILSLRYHRDDK